MQHKSYKKVVLVILDGFGIATSSHGNAIAMARPEVLDYVVSHYPSLSLQASGPLVGLPWGEMGNSEVGHLNIGAGRIVGQDLPRINSAIQDHSFFRNPALLKACQHVKQQQSKLHLVGMISGGGVHSSDEHLFALLGLAAEQGIKEVFIHMFTDGRDTAEKAALESLQKLKERIARIGSTAKIATVSGRFYAMDRGKHWNQTEMTFQAMVNGAGATAMSAEDCVLDNYDQNIFDEMIQPTVIVEKVPNSAELKPLAKITDRDAVIFFNFRSDRALQLLQAFVQPEVMDIQSHHQSLRDLCLVTMTEYFFGLPVDVAFPTINLQNNLAEVIAQNNLAQFHIAESEKYAHVTSFFNGGKDAPFVGEERIIIKSPNNEHNYSDQPEMSAAQVTEVLVEKITKTEINFFVANFANADMVGHTGNMDAAFKAIKFLDRCLEKVMDATLSVDGVMIVTADHGNIEQMLNVKTGQIDKDHTTNPVPFLLVANEFRFEKASARNYVALSARTPAGVVSDLAPTILDLFGLPKPREMTGVNLLDSLDS